VTAAQPEQVSTETTYQPAYTPPAGYPQPQSQGGYAPQPPPAPGGFPPQQGYPPGYQPPTYQQPTYQQPQFQQPGYPPGYQYPPGYPQPGYAQQWAAPAEAGYGNNVLVILGALWLLIAGLVTTLIGVVLLIGGRLLEQVGGDALTTAVGGSLTIVAAVLLVVGILHLLSAIFIWAHRSWARFIGILLAALGTLAGLGILFVTVNRVTLSDGTVIGPPPGGVQTTALIVNGIPFALYAITLLALLVGGGHFSRRRVP
jgi:hypothetical protein